MSFMMVFRTAQSYTRYWARAFVENLCDACEGIEHETVSPTSWHWIKLKKSNTPPKSNIAPEKLPSQ